MDSNCGGISVSRARRRSSRLHAPSSRRLAQIHICGLLRQAAAAVLIQDRSAVDAIQYVHHCKHTAQGCAQEMSAQIFPLHGLVRKASLASQLVHLFVMP